MKHYIFENAAVSLAGTQAAFEFFAPIFVDRPHELLVVALCDKQTRLLRLLSYPGTETSVPVPLRSIMHDAVATGCAGVVMAHNHPSGDVRPSASDKLVTRKLCEALEVAGITLLDHLLFDHDPWFSFRRAGLL